MTNVDPEDVFHEVAFNVFSKIDFESTIENLAAYLYRSIKNKITDIMRIPKRTVALSSFEDDAGSNILLETTKKRYFAISQPEYLIHPHQDSVAG